MTKFCLTVFDADFPDDIYLKKYYNTKKLAMSYGLTHGYDFCKSISNVVFQIEVTDSHHNVLFTDKLSTY